MTPLQRTTLARMSDGDWHTCRDTPDGLAAMEATE